MSSPSRDAKQTHATSHYGQDLQLSGRHGNDLDADLGGLVRILCRFQSPSRIIELRSRVFVEETRLELVIEWH